MDALEGYRKEIDNIDKEITRLFEERMNVVLKVAEYKKENNLPIFHKGREEVVIEKNINRLENKDYSLEIRKFYNSLMEVSRELQSRKLNRENSYEDIKELNISKEDILGFQGVNGSYSEEALLKHFGSDNKRLFFEEFEDVFKALKNDKIKYGILPVENSSSGGINEVHDLLIKYGFYIVGEESIKIEEHLLGTENATLETIKDVYSHPQGFIQSSEFLKNYSNLKLIPFHNTATSAKLVSELNDESNAAIAGERASKIYNLKIIKRNISNNKNNCTRFIIIGKELLKEKDANKISIVFSLEDKPGTLYKLLKHFGEYDLNMIRIQSRPTKGERWKYFLYIDFEGSLQNEGERKALEFIKNSSEYFRLLGWYKKRMEVK
ncbi:MAG: chorismate mutase [Clostridium baratii]|uniref:Bifunctional chorismate mutase/prephenate dehydratase n=1 Tax=Clostridium baratii str. Sullivan TaxID=1415775 RepID=A0A0A7G1J6_9CLOT|nr:chorismate mutase [Clostridium baratii]AIY84851.1 chorismate mutase [Clostridium baratii str. Sullivan]MBS6007730.1 chorismate mutase [Clostridium baratii]MDU1054523.1 chorismate mutase [Clostridium baratii]CUP57646.1 chorismate mutase [Clostridium baratii]